MSQERVMKDLVEITFLDHIAEVMDQEEYLSEFIKEPPLPELVHAVGWIVYEDQRAIIIVHDYIMEDDKKGAEAQVRRYFSIVKSTIKSIKHLGVDVT